MASPAFRRAWPLFALGTLIGVCFLILWPLQAWRDYRTLRVYETTACTVISSRAVLSTTRGWIGRRTFSHDYYLPEVTFSYVVNGTSHSSTGYDNYDGRMSDAGVLVNFRNGGKVRCWYDPARPSDAVVERTLSWAYYGSGVIPLVLTLIPGSFLLTALRSRPRQVALTTTAGTHLAIRLAPEFTNRSELAWRVGIAVVLAAGVLGYVGYAIKEEGLIGSLDYFGFFFLLVVAGAAYVCRLAWQSYQVAGLPDPTIEVDREPARPGELVTVAVGVPGPMTFRELKVTLVCETRGPKRSATPVRHSVLNEASGTVLSGSVLTRTAAVEIPANAEPSESDGDRLTSWKFVVRLTTDRGASLTHEYPFRVQAPETSA